MSWRSSVTILVLLLVLACIAYAPGLRGPFVFDDMANIVDNTAIHVNRADWQSLYQAAFSTSTGPLARPIPMASFALNYAWGGLNEFSFKVTNVVVHFINGILVFLLARILLVILRPALTVNSQNLAALAACAIWLLHPLNLTSVLYVVQRMASMATLFGLLCILVYIKGRVAQRWSVMFAWHLLSALFLLLALLCKENMIVLVPLLAWLEWVLFRFRSHEHAYAWVLRGAFALAGLVIIAYIVYKFPGFVKGYEYRPFSMAERLLTQSRVLFFYLGQILVPNITNMHLFHDEISVSTSLLSPLTTLLSVCGIAGMIVVMVWLRHQFPVFSLALAWYLIGHLVESTFISLELVHGHRNYFPMIGLCILAGYGLVLFFEKRRRSALVVILLVSVSLAGLTHLRANGWSSWEVLVVTEAEKNPRSTRSQYEAGRYFFWQVEKYGKLNYKKEDYEKSVFYFERGATASETSLASLAALVRLADLVGTEGKPEWRSEIVDRIGRLRPDPNDINKVGDMFKCRIEEKCTIDSRFLSEVAAATLSNGRLPLFAQAAIASAASSLAIVENRSDFAVYYAMVALEKSPATYELVLNAMILARLLGDAELAEVVKMTYLPNLTAPDQRERVEQEYRAVHGGQGE